MTTVITVPPALMDVLADALVSQDLPKLRCDVVPSFCIVLRLELLAGSHSSLSLPPCNSQSRVYKAPSPCEHQQWQL